mgnify:CR=1 FL=1
MTILDEFKELNELYNKRYKRQGSFRSLKMMKNSKGEREPVFYVGVPGMMVALTFTLVMICTVYLLYLPFMWYVWVPYVIVLVFVFRISLKYDKAKQIRYMVCFFLSNALNSMEQAIDVSDENEKKSYYTKALDFLEKADKWVDESAIKAQIDILRADY